MSTIFKARHTYHSTVFSLQQVILGGAESSQNELRIEPQLYTLALLLVTLNLLFMSLALLQLLLLLSVLSEKGVTLKD